MSRCGSTLVLNALKEAQGVLGLGEAQPVEMGLQLANLPSQYWSEAGRSALTALVTTLSEPPEGLAKTVLVKCGI
jgi:hypothetical protein